MSELLEPQNVVVLLGGNSPEREISLQSGNAVARALLSAGHQVRKLDPKYQALYEFNWGADAVAVIMLHGTYGEDGQVQAELDSLKIPYTGSGATASQQAFHKQTAKKIFVQSQLQTPAWRVLSRSTSVEQLYVAADAIGYPLVIKPEAQGSSLGVSIVQKSSQLAKAFEIACEFDEWLLVEQAILGEEWTVPILDQKSLPAIRIAAKQSFFDYTAKYEDDLTQYDVLLPSHSEVAMRVTDLSLQACKTMGASGVCRVDLMVDGNGVPWLLEVNTIPGMTDHSLVPKAARHLGWTMENLCERILLSAFANRSI